MNHFAKDVTLRYPDIPKRRLHGGSRDGEMGNRKYRANARNRDGVGSKKWEE